MLLRQEMGILTEGRTYTVDELVELKVDLTNLYYGGIENGLRIASHNGHVYLLDKNENDSYRVHIASGSNS